MLIIISGRPARHVVHIIRAAVWEGGVRPKTNRDRAWSLRPESVARATRWLRDSSYCLGMVTLALVTPCLLSSRTDDEVVDEETCSPPIRARNKSRPWSLRPCSAARVAQWLRGLKTTAVANDGSSPYHAVPVELKAVTDFFARASAHVSRSRVGAEAAERPLQPTHVSPPKEHTLAADRTRIKSHRKSTSNSTPRLGRTPGN